VRRGEALNAPAFLVDQNQNIALGGLAGVFFKRRLTCSALDIAREQDGLAVAPRRESPPRQRKRWAGRESAGSRGLYHIEPGWRLPGAVRAPDAGLQRRGQVYAGV
jgi:hypothetical protein